MTPPRNPKLIWRTAGVLLLLGAAAFAGFGIGIAGPGSPLWWLVVYWGCFALCILGAMYCAVLDLRYIRLEYRLAERQIFEETLGDPAFREEILRAQQELETKQKQGDS